MILYDRSATVSGTNGRQLAVPTTSSGNATVTDSNGNELSADGNGNFTDATGSIVLRASGGAPQPLTLTYTDTGGHSQTVQINYSSYTVQTAFGCSNIGDYGPTQTNLVSSVVFPDSSTYSFQYEATSPGSGNVTGRLASVTLPQGGTISYQYSGGSNGITCADGSTAGLTRSLAANEGSSASTWSYARSSTGANDTHTEIVDGLGNHSAYDFVAAQNQPSGTTAEYYETNRSIYQGGRAERRFSNDRLATTGPRRLARLRH